MDIKTLQDEVNGRWSAQIDNPCHLSSTSHALLHMTKALGRVATVLNDAEHSGAGVGGDVAKYLADLVICALRFAPHIDMDAAVAARLEEKFPAR